MSSRVRLFMFKSPALFLISCVPLKKLLNFSEPQFPNLQKSDKTLTS